MGDVTAAGTAVGRQMVISTLANFAVPVSALLSAPLLAQALGAVGRGEVAAALAPTNLVISAVTLGLPEAVVYFTSRDPRIGRRVAGIGAAALLLAGSACAVAIWLLAPGLGGASGSVAGLVGVAALSAGPALMIGAFRASAMGQARWRRVTAEKLTLAGLRVGLLSWAFLVNVSIAIGLVVVGRVGTTWLVGLGRRRRVTRHSTVLIGGWALAAELAEILRRHPRYGLAVAGFVDDGDDCVPEAVVPQLGGLADLDREIRAHGADVLLIADGDFAERKLLDLVRTRPRSGATCSWCRACTTSRCIPGSAATSARSRSTGPGPRTCAAWRTWSSGCSTSSSRAWRGSCAGRPRTSSRSCGTSSAAR